MARNGSDADNAEERVPEERTVNDTSNESRRSGGAGGGVESSLLWFSVAGAVIMGLLWIVAVTGVFGLTWTVLGETTTLGIAVVAAVGAALFRYDLRSGRRETTG